MATIATLAVSLKAQTKNFRKGMKRANRGLRSFGRSAKQVRGGVGKLTAGFALLAGGAGLGFLIKKSFETIDANAKVGDKLGIATDRLKALQRVANQTGNATGAFNVGLQRMTRRVQEAANGTGEAQGALRTLGLDARNLAQMAPDEQFLQIATAMNKIGSQGERIRLSFKLFDTEGVGLVNTLALGNAELLKQIALADKMGITISRFDSAQVEAANNAFTDMRLVIGGFIDQVAVKLAPFIKAGSDAFVAWAISGEGAAMKVTDAFESLLNGVARLFDFFNFGKGVFFTLVSAIQKGVGFILEAFNQFINRLIQVANLIPGISIGFDKLSVASQSFRQASKESGDQAVASFAAFERGDARKSVEGFFNRARVVSAFAAKEIEKNAKERINSFAGFVAQTVDVGQFKQIDSLSRIAIGGLAVGGKSTQVEDPQLRDTNKLLTEIKGQKALGFA